MVPLKGTYGSPLTPPFALRGYNSARALQQSLQSYCVKHNIIVLFFVDTRAPKIYIKILLQTVIRGL